MSDDSLFPEFRPNYFSAAIQTFPARHRVPGFNDLAVLVKTEMQLVLPDARSRVVGVIHHGRFTQSGTQVRINT